MAGERRASMEQLESVNRAFDLAVQAESSGRQEQCEAILRTTGIGAQIALVLAVQELTDAVRPQEPVVTERVVTVEGDLQQIGWCGGGPDFAVHKHNRLTHGDHSRCKPVWTDL